MNCYLIKFLSYYWSRYWITLVVMFGLLLLCLLNLNCICVLIYLVWIGIASFWSPFFDNDYLFDYGNTLVNYILQQTIDCCTDVSAPESHKLPDNTVHTNIYIYIGISCKKNIFNIKQFPINVNRMEINGKYYMIFNSYINSKSIIHFFFDVFRRIEYKLNYCKNKK